MPQIIKHDQVVEDTWLLLAKDATAEALDTQDQIIAPFSLWQAHRETLSARENVGVWLDADQAVEDLVESLATLKVIALNFPAFTDGRHYSSARLLRERYGFTGEIRAIGDVLRDQLFFMRRCGFDAYAVRADRDIHDALEGLKDFSVTYQAASDDPRPLFRRR